MTKGPTVHKNSGDTLVASLRLGDRLFVHGVDYGDIIALSLMSDGDRDGIRPRVSVRTIGGELDGGRIQTLVLLVVDHVHVGSTPLYPVPQFDGRRAPVQAFVDELQARR